MTRAGSIPTAPGDGPADPAQGPVPEGWRELRADETIQFEPLRTQSPEPYEPGWFARLLIDAFAFLGEVFAPLGRALGAAWPVLQWVLLALALGFFVYGAARLVGPWAKQPGRGETREDPAGWQPGKVEAQALLEDADRLAQDGRYDEAVHLLLQRSVAQIAAARPALVEPSRTARELAAHPDLPIAARRAFAVISERVERSRFARRPLERDDWDRARAAYADFALAPIGGEASDRDTSQFAGSPVPA